MNELLKELFIHFYEKRPAPQLKAEIEQCHQELIEKLDKPGTQYLCKRAPYFSA